MSDPPTLQGPAWVTIVLCRPMSRKTLCCETPKVSRTMLSLMKWELDSWARTWVSPWNQRDSEPTPSPATTRRTSAGNARLGPGMSGSDEIDAIIDRDEPRGWTGWEAGLGRPRVLSIAGRDQAADRWDDGEFGPTSEMAEAASKQCATCGFVVSVAGPLSRSFGVCSNQFAPADGRLVSLAYGCGAHSEVLEPAADDL
ncbi:MAG: DUF3027 domain-containing protein [Actinomycetota bacterium]